MITKIARALSALALAMMVLLGGTAAFDQNEAVAAPLHSSSKPRVDKDSSAGKMKRVEKKRKPSSTRLKPYKYERRERYSARSTQRPASAPCSVVGRNPRTWPAGIASCY